MNIRVFMIDSRALVLASLTHEFAGIEGLEFYQGRVKRGSAFVTSVFGLGGARPVSAPMRQVLGPNR
jgi:hypothetical protein